MPYSLLLIPAFTSTSPFAAVVFGCFLHKPTIMSSALRLSNQKNESFCFSKRDRYWPYVCSNKTAIILCKNSPLPQSCTVAKSDKFWRAIGQSNLADRMEDRSTGQSAVVWVQKPNFWRFCCGQPLYAKFDFTVARQNLSLLVTATFPRTNPLNISKI